MPLISCHCGKKVAGCGDAPMTATAAFLLLAGAGYLRMLKLFARGIANFVVEPTPYMLVFLFALVWLAPVMLARFFRMRARKPQCSARCLSSP